MNPSPDEIVASLLAAQGKADALFGEAVAAGLIRPGITESMLSEEIHALAKHRFGLKRHWHKRVVRSGPNTVLTYYRLVADSRYGDTD